MKICPTTNAKSITEINLNKKLFDWFIIARTGYNYFEDYHNRFGYKKVNIYYKCGQRQLQLHFFSYLYIRSYGAKLLNPIENKSFTLNEILKTVKRVKLLAGGAAKIELFWRNKRYSKLAKL